MATRALATLHQVETFKGNDTASSRSAPIMTSCHTATFFARFGRKIKSLQLTFPSTTFLSVNIKYVAFIRMVKVSQTARLAM